MESDFRKAAQAIQEAGRSFAFTGAGISVESGIPPFRGEGGIWNRYDPKVLELEYFRENPVECWRVLKELFYDFLADARPNAAHTALAELEKLGRLQSVVTQNIDNLHQAAGSGTVHEFHGSTRNLTCLSCGRVVQVEEADLDASPPTCPGCGGLLKPNIVFFGEAISETAGAHAFGEAYRSDLVLIVGTSGDVMPASAIPHVAKHSGATVIEVNLQPTSYTDGITDIFLEGKAAAIMGRLLQEVQSLRPEV